MAIISRAYARQLFGDADPIGQWVGYVPAPDDHKFMIVGEVSDARLNGAERDASPLVYTSINQNPAPVNSIRVRAAGDPGRLTESVRRALYELDPALPVGEVVTLATELNGDLGTEMLLPRLAGIYASLTLLLVAIGFYGVMSSRTARRKNEFAICLVLGATRGHIQMLIVGQTARILIAAFCPRTSVDFRGAGSRSLPLPVCQRKFARNHRGKCRARICRFRRDTHPCSARSICKSAGNAPW